MRRWLPKAQARAGALHRRCRGAPGHSVPRHHALIGRVAQRRLCRSNDLRARNRSGRVDCRIVPGISRRQPRPGGVLALLGELCDAAIFSRIRHTFRAAPAGRKPSGDAHTATHQSARSTASRWGTNSFVSPPPLSGRGTGTRPSKTFGELPARWTPDGIWQSRRPLTMSGSADGIVVGLATKCFANHPRSPGIQACNEKRRAS